RRTIKKRRQLPAFFDGGWKARLFVDQQVLFLLAGLDGGIEPARTLAAAGPGFRRVGRIEVLRRHLAGAATGFATCAEHVFEGITLGLDHVVYFFTQLRNLVLANGLLAGFRLVDEIVELFLIEIADINSHGCVSGWVEGNGVCAPAYWRY